MKLNDPKIIPHEIFVKKFLVDFFSEYNHIQIVRTANRGKMLIIDNEIQFAEYDEYIYHEMFCFPALFSHPNPKKILIIGGGDLLLARQILKDPEIERIDLVELDAYVIKFCVKHFKSLIGPTKKNPRLYIQYRDGYDFLMKSDNHYDIIYLDLPDRKRNCEFVIERSFYMDIKRNLNLNGFVCAQVGNSDKIYFLLHSQKARKKYLKQNSNFFLNYFNVLEKTFKYSILYHEYVPSFFGKWAFILGSDGINLKKIKYEQLQEKYASINKNTLYYSPSYHNSIFFHPKILKSSNSTQD